MKLGQIVGRRAASNTEIEGFITRELEAAGIDYTVNRGFISVSCCYHEHSGRKKLLGFSRTTGGAHCFACRHHGHWNQYAERHGLATFSNDDPRLQDFVALARMLERETEERDPEQPGILTPWSGEWRGLDEQFLAQVPSYRWFDERSDGNRILWPVYQNGRFRGCTSARIDDIQPKTRNLGGLDARRLLFPFDHDLVQGSRAVVLVEGQYDALALLSRGVPAVSMLGLGAWDVGKLRLLAARGVERLVVMMDGDAAGRSAAVDIVEQASEGFDVHKVVLPDGQDPGECDDEYVGLARRLCKAQRKGGDLGRHNHQDDDRSGRRDAPGYRETVQRTAR